MMKQQLTPLQSMAAQPEIANSNNLTKCATLQSASGQPELDIQDAISSNNLTECASQQSANEQPELDIQDAISSGDFGKIAQLKSI